MNYDIITDAEILLKIGSKLKEIRLEKNVKQKELSEKSGLSMFSISQMETGHNTSVQSLVQVLKALDRMDMLDAFLKDNPDEERPMADRQRVSKVAPILSQKEEVVNHHNVRSFSLPENDDYAMAAEDLHREH